MANVLKDMTVDEIFDVMIEANIDWMYEKYLEMQDGKHDLLAQY